MSMIKKIATAGAVAALGLGLGAASASAYDLTGGSYTATNASLGDHSFTAGGYTVICTGASFAGDTENGANAASTNFVPTYSGCDLIGLPASVTTSGPWTLQVTGGSSPNYTGEIAIPGSSSVQIDVPDLGCEIYITTPATFAHGASSSYGTNVLTGTTSGSGTLLNADVYNISYTTNGLCPFGDGDDGQYQGAVNAPGVGVS